MITHLRKLHYVFILLFVSSTFNVSACSMYKTTLGNKTMVGTNEDAWRTSPHIWFETAKNETYGCCFTGSRKIGPNSYAAQSGMNEFGLTFSRLASYHPERKNSQKKNLELIENPDQFVMDVLKSCKNIEEVYVKLAKYDRSIFISDVFVYVEPSGNYLVVEPYELIRGFDPSFVQANFCPSITPVKDRNQKRYRRGRDILSTQLDTSLAFCSNLSNEMHVCRDKIGDGTLLSSIWNTADLKVTLYFYHNYSEGISFNLKEELAKGDHQFEIDSLFPENEEFEQLKSYITPFNTPWIKVLLALVGFFFLLSSFYFLIAAFKSARKKQSKSIRFLLSLMFLTSFCYLFVLATNIEVFYFPAPYESSSKLISLSSYLPYFISGLLLVLIFLFWKKKNSLAWTRLSKGLIVLNSIALSALIVGFFYWNLY